MYLYVAIMIKPFKLQRFNNVSTNLTDIWFYLIPDQHSCATDYHEDSNTMSEPWSFKNCWYWWTIRSSNIGEQIWCIWILLEIKCNKIVPFQYTNSENNSTQILYIPEQYLPETGTSSKTMPRDIKLKTVSNFTLHKLFANSLSFVWSQQQLWVLLHNIT